MTIYYCFRMIKFLILAQLVFSIATNAIEENQSSNVLRTPDSRFVNLEDYPFKPNYIYIDNIRIHYIDEGPKNADPILLLHGLPTWSYLYRKMIPIFVDAGHRVIVPDMVGFGKSDKFIKKNDYSFLMHVNFMKKLVIDLDLNNIVLMGQDWGGPVGMRMAAEMPDRFSAIVMSNGGLPSMPNPQAWLARNIMNFNVWLNKPISMSELINELNNVSTTAEPSATDFIGAFSKWIAHSYYTEDLDIVAVMENLGRIKDLSKSTKLAYEAPYPSSKYKAGANTFASFAVDELANNEKYMVDVYEKWEKPFLIAFGENERITYRFKGELARRIPNPTIIDDIKDAGHFIQEDAGEELAILINNFISEEVQNK